MKSNHPPRPALALLRWFAGDNEPLVGDLIEQFAAGRSRAWFWRQTLHAIVFMPRPRGSSLHPLHLGDDIEPPVSTALPRRVNISASPLPDVGGLGILVLILIVAMVRPEAWWMAVTALAGGVILGAILVLRRRHQSLSSAAASHCANVLLERK